jgi:murein DD-endopeptidase MepM/ murein hydrolase activator NlpD
VSRTPFAGRARARAGAAILCAVLHGVATGPAAADQLYRYRDAQGQWQFTDRPPDAGTTVEALARDVESLAPRLVVERADDAAGAALRIVNELHCAVEVVLELVDRENVSADVAAAMHWIVPARDESRVLVPAADPSAPVDFRYRYAYVLGDPQAEHDDGVLYRVPYAQGSTFTVTQGFHGAVTHASRANVYAIDVAMPVGTGVVAARDGIVIEIAYANYSGGMDALSDGSRANIVRIAHADGTFALYAHLDRASVRVRPGMRVRAGQYIADSGNTGFTTGPHLHFAVLRNRGFELTSVPFRFRGPSGSPVTPREGEPLTAHP